MWANRAVYLFILPGYLWYVVFHYLPILGNVIAFKDYSIFVGIIDSPWVGLENFVAIFDDPAFAVALRNTLVIEGLQLLFAFPAPLALALLLNSLINEKVKRGIQSVAVTAGYIGAVARRDFYAKMDAANVDLKGFTDGFYFKLCGAHLQPVLDTLTYLKHETDVWFEITTLLIPAAEFHEGGRASGRAAP